jgi:hypothetical protein
MVTDFPTMTDKTTDNTQHTTPSQVIEKVVTHHSLSTSCMQALHSPLENNMFTTSPQTNNNVPIELPTEHIQLQTPQTQGSVLSTQKSTSQDVIPTTQESPHTRNINKGIQSILTPNNKNTPFGNLISAEKPPNTVRIWFQNVNGIQKAQSWQELSSFSQKARDLQVDIVGTSETNLKWNFKRNQQARAILQRHHKTTSLTTSSTSEDCLTAYQPGGTLTAILNKYVGRIQTAIRDPTSLGRWSGFKLNTNFGKPLNILTVYQPTKSDGLHTTYQQQLHYYRLKGTPNPDPRKLLMQDLEKTIAEYNQRKEETIVLIDANDGLHQRNSLLPMFLANTNLVSLIPNTTNHPATHIRGSHCIDYIFGSTRILDHIHAAGISAFFDEPWPNTDHRSLFIDIDELGLFGATLETIPPPIRRVITSKSKKSIEKFISYIEQSNKIDQLLDSIQNLSQTNTWDKHHHEAIERIDEQFTEELLTAESKCATPIDFPWSPTIQHKASIYQYWLTTFHSKRNNINVDNQLSKIQDQLPPHQVHQGNPKRPILKQLKLARKHLINARLRADELREEYLELLQEIAINEGNMTRAEAVRQLANKERQVRCWRTFKLLRQGKNTQGGITHILVPTVIDGQETLHIVYEKQKMDETLLHRNIHHFSQADTTPFTTSPLLDILGEDGCTNAALEILEGVVPKGLSKYPTMLLQKLNKVREPISLEFTIQDMCHGFSKWREKTTTSPSAKHLGIYRALIVADKYLHKDDSDKNTKPSTANKCLQIQHLLMVLAITHCHTYKRWTVVHNFLIEKTPGLPRIDKLRVIHLYEADWSLIQKFFVAFKLNKLASAKGTVPIEQAGGRPGRSAIELAASRVLTFETIRLQRLSGAVVYNDAKACYDRVIENISNLALLKQGLPIELARLHAQTFHNIRYYIKHKLGISTTPHSHKNPKPIYGVGQGSTDAPARWGFLCDPLLELYKELASDAVITSPLSSKSTNNKIAGFVDDTTTLTIKHYTVMLFIIILLQRDAQIWERLLFTSGGKLEIPKCIFAIFDWNFDSWGRPVLSSTSSNHLHLQSSETKQHAIIPQMSTTKAYKYVGIQLALDGNMEAQIHDLQKKCQSMSTVLSQTYFNAREADLGFTTVFTPSVKYALPVTSIPQHRLQTIQKPTINSVLPRLGYNTHMPRSVVFGTKSRGGIGLLNLPTEQGTSQIQLLISHIRARSYLYKTIIILIETYQLAAGTTTSPLLDTTPRLYIDSPWIQSVQHFLQTINGTIYIPDIMNITPNRINDSPIMSIENNMFTKSDLECINACRIFLQVTYMSEICNDNGTTILQDAIKGTVDINDKPLIWKISTSKLTWPRQPRPPTSSWNKWKKYLQTRTSTSFKIEPPLGSWTNAASTQRQWHYAFINDTIVHNTETSQTVFTKDSSRTRRRTYTKNPNHPGFPETTSNIPIIPHQITPERLTGVNQHQNTLVPHVLPNHVPSLSYSVRHVTTTSNTTHMTETDTSNATITYHITSHNRRVTTYALISIENTPHAVTSFQIPDHRQTTSLSYHAYSCIIPLSWLYSYTNQAAQHYNICIHCNSKQIRNQLQRVHNNNKSPSHCYCPEWDLLQSTVQLATKFKSHQFKSCHLQDIIKDKQQNKLLQLINNDTPTCRWETKSFSYDTTQLLIHNQRVPSDYTSMIREAHTAPAIDAYYITKYGWDNKTVNNIMWKEHGRALTNIPKRMCKTITQFNHEWLPVNASHSMNAVGTGRLCPFCATCDEDQHHFISCTHPHLMESWSEAAGTIKSKLTSYDKLIHHHLIQLISLSVTDWRTTPTPPIPLFLHSNFHHLFLAQSKIGWNHILKGRFSKQWRHHLYQDRERTTQWITFTIRTIWYHLYSVWKTRCQKHHGVTNDDKMKRSLLVLTPKVQALYEQGKALDSSQCTSTFEDPMEDLLTKPIPTIKSWVHKVTLRLRTLKEKAKAKKRQEKIKITQIHPFFLAKQVNSTIKPNTKQKQKHKSRQTVLLSTTLTAFFPQIRKKQPLPRQNDLFPP